MENGRDILNLCRHHNGKLEAKRLRLREHIENYDVVSIKIPEHIASVSPSYCKGLLEDSLSSIDDFSTFRQRIKFDGSPEVLRWIEIGLRNLASSFKASMHQDIDSTLG
jgi:hypothetical protein